MNFTRALPSRMRAVQVLAPGRAVLVETPLPQLELGQILLRVRLVSLCGSDIRWLHYAAPQDYPMAPGTTGHEVIAEVVAGGALQPGTLALTLVDRHEGMAEYCLAREEDVIALPPGPPPEQLLQAQQLGTVLYACKHLPNVVGQDVVVIGQGTAGLWFDFLLRRMGAGRVIAVDLQEHRLRAGRMYGATDTIHNVEYDAVTALAELSRGRMADIVIEAAGEVSSINLAVALARPFGFILNFGVPRAQIAPFAIEEFFFKCLQSRAIVGATRDENHACTRQALRMIAEGEIDVAPVLTHRFPFTRAVEAYELQCTRDEGALKIVVEFD